MILCTCAPNLCEWEDIYINRTVVLFCCMFRRSIAWNVVCVIIHFYAEEMFYAYCSRVYMI